MATSDDRPLWFVFAGMGTQWAGMGRDLMTLDIFRQSILRSDRVLQRHNVALYNLLMKGDQTTFNDTLNSFVGIAAIQVHGVVFRYIYNGPCLKRPLYI